MLAFAFFCYASTLFSEKTASFLIQKSSTTKRCAKEVFSAPKWKRKNFGARKTTEVQIKVPLSATVTAAVVLQAANSRPIALPAQQSFYRQLKD